MLWAFGVCYVLALFYGIYMFGYLLLVDFWVLGVCFRLVVLC